MGELYSLGPDAFAGFNIEHIYGLVFLFKWQQQTDERPIVDANEHGIFFANQVIQNACATQAILSVLMNADGVDIGSHLKEFKGFASSLDSQMKGLAISNSEPIRKAHNSFRSQSSFEIIRDRDAPPEDAFHFIGYICHAGSVYELDGLKQGPLLIGAVPENVSWVEIAREEVQQRINATQPASTETSESGVELRFNLMAIVKNRQADAEEKILRHQYLRQRANISLVSRGEELELVEEVDDDEAPADIPSFDDLSNKEVEEVHAIVEQCTEAIKDLSAVMEAEKKKRDKWAKENARRRHDLVPLALCALRHLARKHELVPAFEKGKTAHLKRMEENKAPGAP